MPCCPVATILHDLSSSIAALTLTKQSSSSFPLSVWKVGKDLCLKLPLPPACFNAALTLPVKQLPLLAISYQSNSSFGNLPVNRLLHCNTYLALVAWNSYSKDLSDNPSFCYDHRVRCCSDPWTGTAIF